MTTEQNAPDSGAVAGPVDWPVRRDGAEVREMQRATERTFAKKLRKAGWYTYTDEETGRVLTNAYDYEVAKLAKISGMPCEVVNAGWDGGCARIGPVLSA
jgi:hypothetical protein